MIKKILCIIATAIVIGLLTQPVLAEGETGIYFSHLDWEIACDNTLTCRAAGYQQDDDELAVSILLTRRAGPQQAVTGKLEIGSDNKNTLKALPKPIRLKMIVNGRTYGGVTINIKSLTGELSRNQVEGLVSSLAHKSKIEFVDGKNTWHLSDAGAAAVLLKMDDVQGRVGTVGALIRKGDTGEKKVKSPIPAPVVVAASVVKQKYGLKRLSAGEMTYLRSVLRQTVKEDDCPNIYQNTPEQSEISIYSLTGKKLLASTLCWLAAYNAGSGYWVINNRRPYNPVLVTTDGDGYSKGEITSYQKGRGVADCVDIDDWTWDGKRFIHTKSLTTGLCKSLAPGGAWKLLTKVTVVRYSK